MRADDYQDALRKAALATYKYNGWDERARELDKRYVPNFIHEYGGPAAALVTLCIEHRISWKWSF